VRKERGLTQVGLARKVGTQQALVSAYETDRLRLSAEMAIRFALALDELLSPRRHGRPDPKPARRLLRRMELIERLPRCRQAALLSTIDAFLRGAKQAS